MCMSKIELMYDLVTYSAYDQHPVELICQQVTRKTQVTLGRW